MTDMKRIYRRYSEAGLAVRKNVEAKRYRERVALIAAETVNQTWSLDFVSHSAFRRKPYLVWS